MKLEELLGRHLDVLCDEGDVIDKTKPANEYKTMTNTDTKRVNSYIDAVTKINSYNSGSITVAQYKQNLEYYASLGYSYNDYDCSGYTKLARGVGAHGSTTNFCQETVFFGHIQNLGGADKLIVGMELFQGCRKRANGSVFWTKHIGVYAGKQMLNGKYQHTVWQSSPSYGTLDHLYSKSSGPNLTALGSNWNYWGWSKFVNLH